MLELNAIKDVLQYLDPYCEIPNEILRKLRKLYQNFKKKELKTTISALTTYNFHMYLHILSSLQIKNK